jgi:hypothetical protein
VYINGKMIQLFIGRVRCKRITHSPFTSALRVLCPDAEFVFLSPLKRNFTFFALGTFLAPAFACFMIVQFLIRNVHVVCGLHR